MTRDICREQRILYVDDEAIMSRIMLAKSITEPMAPNNIRSIYPTQASNNTRSGMKTTLTIPKFKSNVLINSSAYQVPYTWNLLHESAQKLDTKKLSTFIRDQLTEIY